MNIEPYIQSKSKVNGFWFYHYLQIQGGTGKKDGHGGQYRFYLTYLEPEQRAQLDNRALDYWCKDKKIPCGVGDTIEQAYEDFKAKNQLNPIK
jgi:hypothetical protein